MQWFSNKVRCSNCTFRDKNAHTFVHIWHWPAVRARACFSKHNILPQWKKYISHVERQQNPWKFQVVELVQPKLLDFQFIIESLKFILRCADSAKLWPTNLEIHLSFRADCSQVISRKLAHFPTSPHTYTYITHQTDTDIWSHWTVWSDMKEPPKDLPIGSLSP